MAVKWSELQRYSLVEVELGFPKNLIENKECVDLYENEYYYGINVGGEFSYRHRAIVVSKSVKGSKIGVLPITEWNPMKNYTQEQFNTNLFVKQNDYKSYFTKDSIILIDEIKTIDKKMRVKKIIRRKIPFSLIKLISQKIMDFYIDNEVLK